MSDLADRFVAGFWTRAEALAGPLGDLTCFALVMVGCLAIIGTFAWTVGTGAISPVGVEEKRP